MLEAIRVLDTMALSYRKLSTKMMFQSFEITYDKSVPFHYSVIFFYVCFTLLSDFMWSSQLHWLMNDLLEITLKFLP